QADAVERDVVMDIQRWDPDEVRALPNRLRQQERQHESIKREDERCYAGATFRPPRYAEHHQKSGDRDQQKYVQPVHRTPPNTLAATPIATMRATDPNNTQVA